MNEGHFSNELTDVYVHALSSYAYSYACTYTSVHPFLYGVFCRSALKALQYCLQLNNVFVPAASLWCGRIQPAIDEERAVLGRTWNHPRDERPGHRPLRVGALPDAL